MAKAAPNRQIPISGAGGWPLVWPKIWPGVGPKIWSERCSGACVGDGDKTAGTAAAELVKVPAFTETCGARGVEVRRVKRHNLHRPNRPAVASCNHPAGTS